MSEEIKEIFTRHFITIMENTVPEKREETAELLGSIMLEIAGVLSKLENNMIDLLKNIEKAKKESN